MLFAALVGLWLGLGLLKFGNPVILANRIEPPADWLELLIAAWPAAWGYGLAAGVVLASIPFWRRRRELPLGLLVLPLAWWLWQLVASFGTVDAYLTQPVLLHFASLVLSFYVGYFALSSVRQMRLFWITLLGAFVGVLLVGWQQHFGGLEETRRYFYALDNWQQYPPEFLKKISSNRIYGTLFYPNALAGAILLLLPILLVLGWQLPGAIPVKWTASGALGLAALACLYWSGSKAGWLIMLALAGVALLHSPLPRRFKLSILGLVLAGGLIGFLLTYANYFSRGATSVSARLDYWRAGWTLTLQHPILGSGPGTFMRGYQRLKAPEAEMARLAHNDYLQQGADSGIPGMLLYLGAMAGLLVWLYRYRQSSWVFFGVWLGLFGLAVQSMVEFGLYIPALAWPQFLFLGWLSGQARKPMDNSSAAS